MSQNRQTLTYITIRSEKRQSDESSPRNINELGEVGIGETVRNVNVAPVKSLDYPTVPLSSPKYPTVPVSSSKYPTVSGSSSKSSTVQVNASKYPTVPVSSSKYPTVPVSSSKYPTVQVSTSKSSTVQVNASKYPTVPVSSSKYPTVPVSSSKFPTVPVSSSKYPIVPVNPSKYPIVPVNPSKYPTVPVSSSKYPTVPVSSSKFPLSSRYKRTQSDDFNQNVLSPTYGVKTSDAYQTLYSPPPGCGTRVYGVDNRIFKLGERGSGLRARGEVQDFNKLRQECLSEGTLFEDPEFPAVDSSIFFSKSPPRPFEWKRPMEIADDPQLFVEGASRFDIQQGELGDCWLLAAMANLTLNSGLFAQIVPHDQGFGDKYAGIFHFRFWQYGRWVDVVIDDRLPTVYGKLVFLHSSEPNEFWSALFEKAYAKLHGSYESLKGGTTCEAMEDFTGGVTEMYELNQAPPNLYQIMIKAYERESLMACSIEPDPHVLEAQTPQGLVKGHAYSVTRVKFVNIATPNMAGKIPLIRLRNPWGNEAEWNGAWSDKSPEWRFIPDDEKEEIGLTFDDDGEFWISYKDFQNYFNRLEICNLNPDSLTEELDHDGKRRWEMSMFEGEWVRGVTAGGCRNFLETFWHNPQYRITLEDPDEDDDDNKCTVIVGLMQKNRRSQRRMGAECLTIGFAIYHLKDPDSLPKPLDLDFFKYNMSVARSPSFINLREVSCRFKLPPGVYCIVPSTFEPNEEGEFILRVFSENKNNMEENDEEVGLGEVDERARRIGGFRPGIHNVKNEPEPEEEKGNEKVKEFFKKIAGEDLEVDWIELKEILDYAMRHELPRDSAQSQDSFITSVLSLLCGLVCKDTALGQAFETKNEGFSKDVCRSMIAMMDVDRSGKLGFEEFKCLWLSIRQWKAVFKLYDKDSSGYLSPFELRQALNSAGYRLNNNVLNVLAHRYGSKGGMISFDDFMMCAIKLKAMIEIFHERDPDNTNTATFTLEEWVEKTLYS